MDNKLYVGNLGSITSSKLEELFAKYGKVEKITLIEGKGFGFIEMSSPQEAQASKEALNGLSFEGRTLKVDNARQAEAKPRRDFRRY